MYSHVQLNHINSRMYALVIECHLTIYNFHFGVHQAVTTFKSKYIKMSTSEKLKLGLKMRRRKVRRYTLNPPPPFFLRRIISEELWDLRCHLKLNLPYNSPNLI